MGRREEEGRRDARGERSKEEEKTNIVVEEDIVVVVQSSIVVTSMNIGIGCVLLHYYGIFWCSTYKDPLISRFFKEENRPIHLIVFLVLL